MLAFSKCKALKESLKRCVLGELDGVNVEEGDPVLEPT